LKQKESELLKGTTVFIIIWNIYFMGFGAFSAFGGVAGTDEPLPAKFLAFRIMILIS